MTAGTEKISVGIEKKYYSRVLLAVILIISPNFNMIDFLPDFIGYFLLASAIGDREQILPYFAEARSALTKLGFVSLARIPGMLIMYSNMYSGRDVVPLFTLIFSVIEVIFLVQAVTNGFSALYYLGERGSAKTLIAPFGFMGRTVRAETVKNATLFYVVAKAVLNTLPQFCLLSFTPDQVKLIRTLRMIFPYLEVIGMALCLILGIFWLLLVRRHLWCIRSEGEVAASVLSVAGEEKLARLSHRKAVKTMLSTLVLLMVSSLFTFDLAFDSTDNINLLPHFIYGILLMFIGWRLFDKKYRPALMASGCAYSLISAVCYLFSVRFFSSYTYLDLLGGEFLAGEIEKGAIAAYNIYEGFGVLECIALAALISVMAVGFADFIRRNTGSVTDGELYTGATEERHRTMCIKGYVLFGISFAIGLFKCINIFLHGNVTAVSTEDAKVFATPALPWFGTLIFVLSVALVFFSYMYITDLREDVRMKHATEDEE